MLNSKKVYNWIIISFLAQILLLFFFNNVYLQNRGNAKTTLVSTKTESTKKEYKFDVPQNSKDIRVSYDNAFASYILEGKLCIYDINEKKVVKTISYETDEITFYKWLPDRNMVIYATKAPDNQAGKVQVITYHMDTAVEHVYPKITGIPAKSRISDIELSPLTNVVYAKVLVGNGSAKVYKYDIMSQLSFAFNITEKTIIKEMIYDNKLVYQDDQNKVFTWDGLNSSTKQIQFKEKQNLFAINGLDDEIYVGELNSEGKIIKIRYGISSVGIDKWQVIELKASVMSKNIYITADGSIYERLVDKNEVVNLRSNEKITYKGELIEIFSHHVVSREGNTVKIEATK